MCEDVAPCETIWCNHKRNYTGGDRFCRWCGLDYHHPSRGKLMRKMAWLWYWYEAPIRSWYNQHDLVVISSWASASIVLLSIGFHVIGFLMAVSSFAFGCAGLFLADME